MILEADFTTEKGNKSRTVGVFVSNNERTGRRQTDRQEGDRQTGQSLQQR